MGRRVRFTPGSRGADVAGEQVGLNDGCPLGLPDGCDEGALLDCEVGGETGLSVDCTAGSLVGLKVSVGNSGESCTVGVIDARKLGLAVVI